MPAALPPAAVYYSCGSSVCRVAPDGSGQGTVATGRDYRAPSVSWDGRHLSWIEPTADLFAGDGTGGSAVGPLSRFAVYDQMAPDGSAILAFEGAGQPGRICIYAVGGGECRSQAGGGTGGWANDDRVLLATYDFGDPAEKNKSRSYDNKVCLLKPDGGETGGECETTYAYDGEYELGWPTQSPDGTTVAVTRAPWDQPDATQIALYDVATQSLKAVLTSGPGDTTPQWAPDGSAIAFERDGGIWVVAADGAPGSERRVADGTSPSWARVSASALGKVALAATQVGKVRGTATLRKPGKLEVDLVYVQKGKGTVVGRQVTRPAAGKRRFAVALAGKVRRTLVAHHVKKLPLTVLVKFTPLGAAPASVQRKVTLRLR